VCDEVVWVYVRSALQAAARQSLKEVVAEAVAMASASADDDKALLQQLGAM
jgi:hypothetical protein